MGGFVRRCGAGGIAAWAAKGRRRDLRRRAEFEVSLLSRREGWRIRNGYPYTSQKYFDVISGVSEMERQASAVMRAHRAGLVRGSIFWPHRRLPQWRVREEQQWRLGWGGKQGWLGWQSR